MGKKTKRAPRLGEATIEQVADARKRLERALRDVISLEADMAEDGVTSLSFDGAAGLFETGINAIANWLGNARSALMVRSAN